MFIFYMAPAVPFFVLAHHPRAAGRARPRPGADAARGGRSGSARSASTSPSSRRRSSSSTRCSSGSPLPARAVAAADVVPVMVLTRRLGQLHSWAVQLSVCRPSSPRSPSNSTTSSSRSRARHGATASGLSRTAAATLARLQRSGPARLTELAAAEGVTQPSMSALVARLVDPGAGAPRRSTRRRAGPCVLSLTPAGAELLARRRADRDRPAGTAAGRAARRRRRARSPPRCPRSPAWPARCAGPRTHWR